MYNLLMDRAGKDRAEVGKKALDISYTTPITLGKHRLTLITQLMPHDEKSPNLTSFSAIAYEKDKVVYKLRKDYTEDIDINDASQLQRVMDTVNKEAVAAIRSGEGIRKEPQVYIKNIKAALSRKKPAAALAIAREALEMHPDDSLILSYNGYLTAMAEKKYKAAIGLCERAVNLLPRKLPHGLDKTNKPIVYWHLSRVLQATGNRKGAVDVIYRGIGFDVEGGLLHRELEKLGVRRRPVIPFLGRPNIINRMLGRTRHVILGSLDHEHLRKDDKYN